MKRIMFQFTKSTLSNLLAFVVILLFYVWGWLTLPITISLQLSMKFLMSLNDIIQCYWSSQLSPEGWGSVKLLFLVQSVHCTLPSTDLQLLPRILKYLHAKKSILKFSSSLRYWLASVGVRSNISQRTIAKFAK